MKKLNKKGFTLVELLAVIVILALLIVVVATTALPAMNNAKKNSLETYSKRVVEQAKTLFISAQTGGTVNECTTTKCTFTQIKNIMGNDVDSTYSIPSGKNITVEYDTTNEKYVIKGYITGSGYTTEIDSTVSPMYKTS